MRDRLGTMVGRLSPSVNGRMQAFPTHTWESEFEICSSLNLQYLEWIIDENTIDDNPLLQTDGVELITDLSKKNNVLIHSLLLHFFVETNIFYSYASNNAVTHQLLTRIFQRSSQLGIQIIEIPFLGASGLTSSMLETKEFGRFFDFLSKLARSNGISLSIESNLDISNTIYFTKLYDQSHIGITLDTGNITLLGIDLDEYVGSLGQKLFSVHIKDCGKNIPTMPLGDGIVDFRALFKHLHLIRYLGLITLEATKEDVYFNDKTMSPIETLRKYIYFLEAQLR